MSQERPIRLHAGPWTVEFERWSGWVRGIRLGGIEVVRAVYSVVRGDDWTTMSQRIVTSHVSQEDGSFQATWKSELDDMAFSWEGCVWSDGKTLQIETIGTSGQSYESRRTGMCVLHPREVSGLACTVTHNDGTTDSGVFPVEIPPDQPFFDIRTLSHSVGDATLQMEFKGEVFEMEDQRNYTDVSFKTYVRPQSWPQPFAVKDGDVFHHGLHLSYTGTPTDGESPSCVLLTPSEEWIPVPRIGTYGHRSEDKFDFLLNPEQPADWSPAKIGEIHQAGSFIEFNRSRSNLPGKDGIAFGATPQVHAFDERTIMENTHGIADIVRNAREFVSGKKVAIGPLALKNRRQEFDDRLSMSLGPTWLLASLVSAAEGGAAAVSVIKESDFTDDLAEVVQLLRQAKQIRLLHSTSPYQAIGFQIENGGKTVLVNLRPYVTSVTYQSDHELDPYEIRVVES